MQGFLRADVRRYIFQGKGKDTMLFAFLFSNIRHFCLRYKKPLAAHSSISLDDTTELVDIRIVRDLRFTFDKQDL